jgi:hypothetical protein
MNLSKQLILLATCLLTGSAYADNCYDPQTNSEYSCQVVVEYGAPVENEVVYGYSVPVDDDVYTTRTYNGYYHGNYNGNNYNGSYHGGDGNGWRR